MKYELYENSVQTPKAHAETFSMMYTELHGKRAHLLREDFCGTFAISCEWVKLRSKNKAICLDLDLEPLTYGQNVHLKKLKPIARKRIKILQKNVVSVTSPKVDIVAACNFSFFIFKQRKELIKYFKAVLKSLNEDGILILELAGGPGMIKTMKERSQFNHRKYGQYTYIWDQESFDPITHDAKYSIHFKLKNGKIFKNVFTYDWRLWTIPEIYDALIDAGFKCAHTYWDVEINGEATGEYIRQTKGDNAFSWIAYVVGEK